MKRCFSLVCVILISACFTLQASASTLKEIKKRGYIKVGLNIENKPFEFYDADKNVLGFDVDIIKEIARRWQVKVKFVDRVWGDLIPSLISRKYDVLIGPMTITSKRAKVIAFTLPHFNAGQTAVVRANEKRIHGEFGLIQRKLAVTRGSTCVEAAKQIEEATVLVMETLQDNVEAVISKKADALIIDRPIAMSLVKEHKGKLKIAGRPFTIEYYGYAVHKADSELLMEFNQALTILKEDGTYDRIIEKWF